MAMAAQTSRPFEVRPPAAPRFKTSNTASSNSAPQPPALLRDARILQTYPKQPPPVSHARANSRLDAALGTRPPSFCMRSPSMASKKSSTESLNEEADEPPIDQIDFTSIGPDPLPRNTPSPSGTAPSRRPSTSRPFEIQPPRVLLPERRGSQSSEVRSRQGSLSHGADQRPHHASAASSHGRHEDLHSLPVSTPTASENRNSRIFPNTDVSAGAASPDQPSSHQGDKESRMSFVGSTNTWMNDVRTRQRSISATNEPTHLGNIPEWPLSPSATGQLLGSNNVSHCAPQLSDISEGPISPRGFQSRQDSLFFFKEPCYGSLTPESRDSNQDPSAYSRPLLPLRMDSLAHMRGDSLAHMNRSQKGAFTTQALSHSFYTPLSPERRGSEFSRTGSISIALDPAQPHTFAHNEFELPLRSPSPTSHEHDLPRGRYSPEALMITIPPRKESDASDYPSTVSMPSTPSDDGRQSRSSSNQPPSPASIEGPRQSLLFDVEPPSPLSPHLAVAPREFENEITVLSPELPKTDEYVGPDKETLVTTPRLPTVAPKAASNKRYSRFVKDEPSYFDIPIPEEPAPPVPPRRTRPARNSQPPPYNRYSRMIQAHDIPSVASSPVASPTTKTPTSRTPSPPSRHLATDEQSPEARSRNMRKSQPPPRNRYSRMFNVNEMPSFEAPPPMPPLNKLGSFSQIEDCLNEPKDDARSRVRSLRQSQPPPRNRYSKLSHMEEVPLVASPTVLEPPSRPFDSPKEESPKATQEEVQPGRQPIRRKPLPTSAKVSFDSTRERPSLDEETEETALPPRSPSPRGKLLLTVRPPSFHDSPMELGHVNPLSAHPIEFEGEPRKKVCLPPLVTQNLNNNKTEDSPSRTATATAASTAFPTFSPSTAMSGVSRQSIESLPRSANGTIQLPGVIQGPTLKSKYQKPSSRWGERFAQLGQKASEGINSLTQKVNQAGFIPDTLENECDKGAKVIRTFCNQGIIAKGGENMGSRDDASKLEGSDRKIITIPPEVIQKAVGLAIFTTLRGGISVSGGAGSGILVARMNDNNWSPPAAIQISHFGGGLTAGVDIYDCICVINTEDALAAFMETRVSLGASVAVAYGPWGAGRSIELMKESKEKDGRGRSGSVSSVQSDTPSFELNGEPLEVKDPADVKSKQTKTSPVYFYVKSKGLFAGCSYDGNVITERRDANTRFYGEVMSTEGILRGFVTPPDDCKSLENLQEALRDAEYEGLKQIPESAEEDFMAPFPPAEVKPRFKDGKLHPEEAFNMKPKDI